jgi:hypothetical protein
MANQDLGTLAKVAIALGFLASLSCFITAFVIFIQVKDWPARYIYAGVSILAVMFIALRRRARRARMS